MKRFSIFVVAIVALVAAIAISTGHSDGNDVIASSHDATPTPTPTPTPATASQSVWLPLDCSHIHPNHAYERYRNVRFDHKGAHSELAGEAISYVSELVQELCEAGVETHHWATPTPTPVPEQATRDSGAGSSSSSTISDDDENPPSDSDSDSRSSDSDVDSRSSSSDAQGSPSNPKSSSSNPGAAIISFFFGEENDDGQDDPLISARSSHATPTPTPTPTLTPAQLEEWIEAVRPDPNRQCKVTGTYVVPPADNPSDTTSYGNETTYRANGWRIETYTPVGFYRTSYKPPRTRSFASGVGTRKWVSYKHCS